MKILAVINESLGVIYLYHCEPFCEDYLIGILRGQTLREIRKYKYDDTWLISSECGQHNLHHIYAHLIQKGD